MSQRTVVLVGMRVMPLEGARDASAIVGMLVVLVGSHKMSCWWNPIVGQTSGVRDKSTIYGYCFVNVACLHQDLGNGTPAHRRNP